MHYPPTFRPYKYGHKGTRCPYTQYYIGIIRSVVCVFLFRVYILIWYHRSSSSTHFHLVSWFIHVFRLCNQTFFLFISCCLVPYTSFLPFLMELLPVRVTVSPSYPKNGILCVLKYWINTGEFSFALMNSFSLIYCSVYARFISILIRINYLI